MPTSPTHHIVEKITSSEWTGRIGQAACGDLVLRVLSRSAGRGCCNGGPERCPAPWGVEASVALKREGDGGTPRGRWRLRLIFYRPDHGLGRLRPPLALTAAAPRGRMV